MCIRGGLGGVGGLEGVLECIDVFERLLRITTMVNSTHSLLRGVSECVGGIKQVVLHGGYIYACLGEGGSPRVSGC